MTHSLGSNGKTPRIIPCLSGDAFARKVITELETYFSKEGITPEEPFYINSRVEIFANTEEKQVVEEHIRGRRVYIIQDVENHITPVPKKKGSCSISLHRDGVSAIDNKGEKIPLTGEQYPNDTDFMALVRLVDAVKKRAHAKFVTVVVPCFPYARQDRKRTREPMTAQLAARILELAGADHVFAVDIHNPAVENAFTRIDFDNLNANHTLMAKFRDMRLKNVVIVAPDSGAAERATHFASHMKVSVAHIYKIRDYSTQNVVAKMMLNGDVKGKTAILVDDMIDTGGTILKAAELLKEKGAEKVYTCVTHPIFSDPAPQRLRKAYDEGVTEGVIATDTVTLPDSIRQASWFEEASVAKYVAKVIFTNYKGESISRLMDD